MEQDAHRSADSDPLEDFRTLAERSAALTERLRSVVVGQREVIEQLLVGVFCQGHVLIVGVPGLAKTMLVRTLAASLDLKFQRIQFTPDMMPSDILGAELIQTDPQTGERSLRFSPGPVFANIVLADEVNRTPPKTQAALLEAMAERQVSIGGSTRKLEAPFIVIATQNPIEQEGTYPLPEAQLDRFMFGLRMTYPKAAEERMIVAESDRIAQRADSVEPLFDGHELVQLRRVIASIPVSEHVVDYAVSLVRATRPEDETCPSSVKRFISWGAGPRAGQALLMATRCLAALEGEPTPGSHHVQRLAPAALRHRLVLNYAASAEGVDADRVIELLLRDTAQPSYE
ncbi:MAG: MoxR family ATPase [Phycisphaeraceae bacterium]|nr:MAG: MoxR family ATPase [Phycisphaeraceae bacterium]